MTCSNPTESCYDRSCKSCPQSDEMYEKFQQIFEKNGMNEIEYKIWATTDRCTILNVCSEVEEFLETLVNKLDKLLLHDYIASKQSQYYSNTKERLCPGELVLNLDFAENYSFVVQNAAQAFHWNNDQVTLFPIVIYYRENDQIHHCSYIGISDCLKHDSISVYMFQKELMTLLKKKFTDIKKIYYFSDGAPQQFKNKKAFANLCNHFSDFDIEAEWHFFATAHGKGPCDGIAGSTKRHATRASLQRGIEKPILTALDFFQWAQTTIKNISFFFIEKNVYEKTELFLEKRFSQSVTVKGTLSYHSLIPLNDSIGYLNAKTFSESTYCKTVKAIKT